MRRLALLTAVVLLALPGAALAVTFPARVVSASARAVTLRLADGQVVRYLDPHVAGASAGGPLLAHAARADGPQITFSLGALGPGVEVLVTSSRQGVTIALPGPGAERHASGVVTAVTADSYELELADHTRVRLHGAGVRACQVASVAYHQDVVLLVADDVRVAARHAAHCSGSGHAAHAGHVQRLARGTVTAAAGGAVTIIDGATGRRETFLTTATPAVGDHVVIVYHGASGGAVADALYAQSI